MPAFLLSVDKADFPEIYCPLLHPGSHGTPFCTKMTECLQTCFQSIKADFTEIYCPPLHPGSLETPF